jgi:hypothetical protein
MQSRILCPALLFHGLNLTNHANVGFYTKFTGYSQMIHRSFTALFAILWAYEG